MRKVLAILVVVLAGCGGMAAYMLFGPGRLIWSGNSTEPTPERFSVIAFPAANARAFATPELSGESDPVHRPLLLRWSELSQDVVSLAVAAGKVRYVSRRSLQFRPSVSEVVPEGLERIVQDLGPLQRPPLRNIRLRQSDENGTTVYTLSVESERRTDVFQYEERAGEVRPLEWRMK